MTPVKVVWHDAHAEGGGWMAAEATAGVAGAACTGPGCTGSWLCRDVCGSAGAGASDASAPNAGTEGLRGAAGSWAGGKAADIAGAECRSGTMMGVSTATGRGWVSKIKGKTSTATSTSTAAPTRR